MKQAIQSLMTENLQKLVLNKTESLYSYFSPLYYQCCFTEKYILSFYSFNFLLKMSEKRILTFPCLKLNVDIFWIFGPHHQLKDRKNTHHSFHSSCGYTQPCFRSITSITGLSILLEYLQGRQRSQVLKF